MLAILVHTLLAITGGALTAALIGWLSWSLLGWAHHPGWGPPIAFVILAFLLPSSDFTQMLLLFGGLLATGAILACLPYKPKEDHVSNARANRRISRS